MIDLAYMGDWGMRMDLDGATTYELTVELLRRFQKKVGLENVSDRQLRVLRNEVLNEQDRRCLATELRRIIK